MLSLIIPTLNEEKILEKTLKSLRALKDFKYEIIISDGRSTDKTLKIAKQYADKVIEHHLPERQTIGQGRNEGAKAATGDFLVFLDADVFIPDINQFFRRALQNFAKDPKLLGLSGWERLFPETETWGDIFGYLIVSDWSFYILNNLLKIGSTCGEFQMIKAETFRQLGGFRGDLVTVEDKDLFYRISRVGHTRTDPKLLLYHTGRRPHALGWPRLLWQWAKDSIHFSLYNTAHADEWKIIR